MMAVTRLKRTLKKSAKPSRRRAPVRRGPRSPAPKMAVVTAEQRTRGEGDEGRRTPRGARRPDHQIRTRMSPAASAISGTKRCRLIELLSTTNSYPRPESTHGHRAPCAAAPGAGLTIFTRSCIPVCTRSRIGMRVEARGRARSPPAGRGSGVSRRFMSFPRGRPSSGC